MTELLIQNKQTLYLPAVKSGIVWNTKRKGSPGELRFSVINDGALSISHGNAVRFKYNGENIFYGFIFSISTSDNGLTFDITAYDQLRYLKNVDSYSYENKTASEFIKMIAEDFNMQIGDIEDTEYKIPKRVEENVTIFDMMQNALDATVLNTKKLFVLFDDFGKMAIKNIASLAVEIVIDSETGESFSYSSSIDSATYNKIKLRSETGSDGQMYIAQDSEHINEWGVLQYTDTVGADENGRAKADSLLDLYNKKARKLSVKGVFGDNRVRAGSLVYVDLYTGETKINNLMLVENCKHSYDNNIHLMDLTLIGGEYIA